jgi:hypothetical protein
MASENQSSPSTSLAVTPDRPLIGIIFVEDGQEVVRYFVDEAEADAAVFAQHGEDARSLAGAWADLDWEEARDALERIRHESEPTPPIEIR